MIVLERLAGDVAASSSGTVAVYASDVSFETTILLGCALCQPLVTQTEVSCQAGQTPSCTDEIAAVMLKLETFIEDLVKVSAPVSVAKKDAVLQADLVTAYTAGNAMENAASASDQVGFQAGLAAFRQNLARIVADSAGIAGSH